MTTTITTTDAQQESAWANVTQVCDYGCHAYEENMGVIWNEPIFKGQTGGVDSILVTLNDRQVGKNKIAADGSFHKSQKTPLPDGEYDLVVRDCGPIAMEPNVETCTLDGESLDDYQILFDGTIRIVHDAIRQQQESGSEEPQTVQEPETSKDNSAMDAKIAELEATIAELRSMINEMLERMNSATQPIMTPQPEQQTEVQVPESIPGQYYIRLLNSTDVSYGMGAKYTLKANYLHA